MASIPLVKVQSVLGSVVWIWTTIFMLCHQQTLRKNFSLDTTSPWQNRVLIIALVFGNFSVWVLFFCFSFVLVFTNHFLYILVHINIFRLVSVIRSFCIRLVAVFISCFFFLCSHHWHNVSWFLYVVIFIFCVSFILEILSSIPTQNFISIVPAK